MATTSRRKSLSLISQLTEEPYRFNFFNAVRLLEQASLSADKETGTACAPLSLQVPPQQEFLHFNTRQQLSFSASDISSIKLATTDSTDKNCRKQWQMTIAFMGLTGSQGVLPFFLSEAILDQLKKKNFGLLDFFEIFNHRAITLMYRAWGKYRQPINFENHKIRQERDHDNFSNAFLSLIGLGLPSLQFRQPYNDESLIPLSGFLSRNICSAIGLESMIKTRFALDAEINQFTGSYSELTPDIASGLGQQNNLLGINTFLGTKCYHCTGKFTVSIRPKNMAEFESLAPGTPLVRSLMSLIRQAVGQELIFDVDVNYDSSKFQTARLRKIKAYEPTLGWNTILGSVSKAMDTFSIRMSSEISMPDDTLPLAN